jgi:hypothetical protein
MSMSALPTRKSKLRKARLGWTSEMPIRTLKLSGVPGPGFLRKLQECQRDTSAVYTFIVVNTAAYLVANNIRYPDFADRILWIAHTQRPHPSCGTSSGRQPRNPYARLPMGFTCRAGQFASRDRDG